MKIAIFASAFHPSLGGVEEVVRQLAHAFKRQNHEVIVLTNRWPRDLPAEEEFEGIAVYRFSFRTLSRGTPLNRARSAVSLCLSKPSTQREIAALLQREKIDIIHVHCVSSNSIYAREAALRLKLPLIVTLHGELTMDAAQIFQRSESARQMMRAAIRNADFITGCSAQTLGEAQEFYGRPFEKPARVIYSGIRLADFAVKAPRPHPRAYWLGIGRHVPQKGFDILLRAYAQLHRESQNAPDLLLAGDGPLHEELKSLARELKVGDSVHFVGRVERKRAVALFQNCEFFVLPSRHEPMGIVNLEAMAAGKAVVASRVGGVPELVKNEKNGLLVPPENVEALANALRRLTNDPKLAQNLGEAGANRVRAFDWDAICAQYLEIYAEVSARFASGR